MLLVNDQMYIGSGGAKSDTAEVRKTASRWPTQYRSPLQLATDAARA